MRDSTRLRSALLALTAAGLAACGSADALAGEFPDHAITLIVSSSPGSGGDATARTYVPFLEKCLGASVAIVNKPGAGGALAHAELLKAAADGYTIGNVNMPNTAAQAIAAGKPMPADTVDYVANVTSSRVTIDVGKNSQFKTLKDLIDYAKANPKVLTLGMSSLGGDDHLTQLQLMKAAGIELTVVPFGDGGSSRAALLGGHVATASMSDGEAATYLEQVQPLAIAGEQRSTFLPDVPTMRELGYDVIGGSNQIVGAPKGTPADALAKLRGCYETVFKDPDFLAEAKKRSIPVFFMNGADTEAYVREQTNVLADLWKTNPWISN
jgi:tripartite-type tricarboxylate transporter receptor subunit TctC